jgi:hypothetical protein
LSFSASVSSEVDAAAAEMSGCVADLQIVVFKFCNPINLDFKEENAALELVVAHHQSVMLDAAFLR